MSKEGMRQFFRTKHLWWHILRLEWTRAKIRVIVGATKSDISDWISFDQAWLDILEENQWRMYFRPSTIHNIVAEHVWEHLTPTEATEATKLCFRFLKPKGRLRIAVPDTLHVSRYLRDLVGKEGSLSHYHQHKVDYNYRTLEKLLRACGFQTTLLDWWDEEGNFHSDYSNDGEGYIMRSFLNWPKIPSVYDDPAEYDRFLKGVPQDKREYVKEKRIKHTSLIIDGIKP
jgi:predicted SAM-dependent methyltransferase